MLTLDGSLPPGTYRWAIGVVKRGPQELRSLSVTFCCLTCSLGDFAYDIECCRNFRDAYDSRRVVPLREDQQDPGILQNNKVTPQNSNWRPFSTSKVMSYDKHVLQISYSLDHAHTFCFRFRKRSRSHSRSRSRP